MNQKNRIYAASLALAMAAGTTAAAAKHTPTALAGLSIPFIANENLSDPGVVYSAPTLAGSVFINPDGEMAYALRAPLPKSDSVAVRTEPTRGWVLTETLVGGKPAPVAGDPAETRVTVFKGAASGRAGRNLRTYQSVRMGEVYPGIELELFARAYTVEKIFTLDPGVSPDAIRLRLEGQRGLTITEAGTLLVDTPLGPVTFSAPIAWQERDGAREEVAVTWRLADSGEYGFRVGARDPALPLVIDPLLQATYYGAASIDTGEALALGSDGSVYIAGTTRRNPFDLTLEDLPGVAGGFQERRSPPGNFSDAFVALLDASLTGIKQATYVSGFGTLEENVALAVASDGSVYVGGDIVAGTDFLGEPVISQDVFVVRLSRDLTALLGSKLVGGSLSDNLLTLAPAADGGVYVAGSTFSDDIPETIGRLQEAPTPDPRGEEFRQDGFIARLDGEPPVLKVFGATYLGGSSPTDAIRSLVVSGDTLYVAGNTLSSDFPGMPGGAQPTLSGTASAGFVAAMTADLTQLTQSTFLGGNGADAIFDIVLGSDGSVYATGFTSSSDFPGTTGGALPDLPTTDGTAFVARLSGNLKSIVQATYLGGSSGRVPFAPVTLALADIIGIWVAGVTDSTDFPKTAGGIQDTFSGGATAGEDAFVALLSTDLTTLVQATYFGGTGTESKVRMARAADGSVYISGTTLSDDLPGTAGGAQPMNASPGDAFLTEAFVARLSGDLLAESPPPPPPVSSILPVTRAVRAGRTATAFATMLNPATVLANDCGIVPTTMVAADFVFQTTDPNTNMLTGTPDTRVAIPSGGSQTFAIFFTTTAAFAATEIKFEFSCDTGTAGVIPGVNTFQLSASDADTPDCIALAASAKPGEVVLSSIGVFAVATANVGDAGTINVTGDTGDVTLPVTITICETNPMTSVCINPTVPTADPVTTFVTAGATPTFGVFVDSNETIVFDPAVNRVYLRISDQNNAPIGATSVALRTTP